MFPKFMLVPLGGGGGGGGGRKLLFILAVR